MQAKHTHTIKGFTIWFLCFFFCCCFLLICVWVWIWLCIWGQKSVSLLPTRGWSSGPHPCAINSLLTEPSSSPTLTSVCRTHVYKFKQIYYWLHFSYLRCILCACFTCMIVFASRMCISVAARRRCQTLCAWGCRQLLAAVRAGTWTWAHAGAASTLHLWAVSSPLTVL